MRGQKGITLVALIITIVVMLILAVVAVTTISETQILDKAKEAAKEWDEDVKAENDKITQMMPYLS